MAVLQSGIETEQRLPPALPLLLCNPAMLTCNVAQAATLAHLMPPPPWNMKDGRATSTTPAGRRRSNREPAYVPRTTCSRQVPCWC